MRDPHELYEMVGELAELSEPVLIQGMSGFVDAGNAAKLAREHLLSIGDPAPAVSFDLDQLFDYRSRRPTMHFVEDHWESYDAPSLTLQLLHDHAGTPFLLLSGPEPDLQWDRFTAAVTALVEHLGVRLTVGMTAIPMAVPHTRPPGVTAHATRAELIADYQPWLQRVEVPASVGNLVEFRLGQAGHAAAGFAAHVPHYLTQNDYPAAAEILLTSVSRLTGLALPTDELHQAAETMRANIDAQVAKSDEVASHVQGLESQYDSMLQSRQRPSLLADPSGLPTAEELGAELERFLAEQSGPGEQPPQ